MFFFLVCLRRDLIFIFCVYYFDGWIKINDKKLLNYVLLIIIIF